MTKPTLHSNATTRTDQPRGPEATRFTLLSHDLRAALSDVLGGLRLVSAQGLDAEQTMQLGRVRVAGEELARLLEEGISFMPDDGPAGPSPLRLGRLIQDSEMRWRGRAQQKGLTLHIEMGADVPAVISADRVALERILSNLLANAIKFTPKGAVSLTLKVCADRQLCFIVQDQGAGFSTAALARLWQAFGRPEDSTVEGSGLGLHICAQMALRLGGVLKVENLPEGARVTLAMPFMELPEEGAAALPDLGGMRVLIAEDSQTNQALLKQVMLSLGAQVELAADGVSALTAYARSRFDLALIDIEMPRLGGMEVIRAIRQTRGADLPIIAVTAYVLRANREAILEAGADAVLSKPLDSTAELGAVIRRALAAHDADHAPARPDLPEALTQRLGQLPQFTAADLTPLLDEAGEMVGRDLLERLTADLTRAERAMVGGLALGDLEVLRTQTHILLSVASAIKAERLLVLARALNTMAQIAGAAQLTETGREMLTEVDRVIQVARREAQDRSGLFAATALSLAQIEARAIDLALARHEGSIPAAARELGVAPSTLYRKIAARDENRDERAP